jgi:transcriptional regulator with XRE-family HTH domain
MAKRMLDRIDQHVAHNIKFARNQSGLTQVAAVTGMSYQRIQNYENGSDRVSASALFRLAKGLSVSPAHFFEGLDGAIGVERLSDAPQAGYSVETVAAGWRELKRDFAMLKTDAAREASIAAVKAIKQLEKRLA